MKEKIITAILMCSFTISAYQLWQTKIKHTPSAPMVRAEKKLDDRYLKSHDMKDFKADQEFLAEMEKHYEINFDGKAHPDDLVEYKKMLKEFIYKYETPVYLVNSTGRKVLFHQGLKPLIMAKQKLKKIKI